MEIMLANHDDNIPYIKVIKRALPAIKQRKPAFGPYSDDKSMLVYNIFISKCYSCENIAIWDRDMIIYPIYETKFTPNDDLSPDIQQDFLEAGRIVKSSPRGAAALLRLCIQKICNELCKKEKTIDAAISALVKRGLDSRIEQALDIVRVVGNEAVHPGQIDLKDDRETAEELFDLVNIIAETMISQPKRISELYTKIPESKRKAIEQRERPILTDEIPKD